MYQPLTTQLRPPSHPLHPAHLHPLNLSLFSNHYMHNVVDGAACPVYTRRPRAVGTVFYCSLTPPSQTTTPRSLFLFTSP
ncbi:hypothetical protein VTJ04DRAFT_8493 [Mycothermus thermophilus]|uniref:uncharacterized protein n=1 Tax=Humicola insolens TaxID=85995 RepID=UPI0037448146